MTAAADAVGATSAAPARTPVVPTIDGQLAEGEWATATRVPLLQQVEPVEGAPVSETTDVLIAYDRNNLYLAFNARDRNPTAIRAAVSKRDDVARDDYVEVWLDARDFRAAAGFVRRTGYDRTYVVLGRSRPSGAGVLVRQRCVPFVVSLWLRDEEGRTDESFLDPDLDLPLTCPGAPLVVSAVRSVGFFRPGRIAAGYKQESARVAPTAPEEPEEVVARRRTTGSSSRGDHVLRTDFGQ